MKSVMSTEPNYSIVPQKYRTFLKTCFKKDPKDRHKSVKEMIADFKKAVQNLKKPVHRLRCESITVSNDKSEDVFGLNADRKPFEYIQNEYQDNEDGTITDHATSLMWQKGGADKEFTYENVNNYLCFLNRNKVAGYDDWRLPTISELVSLVDYNTAMGQGMCISPIFDKKQVCCWSSDHSPEGDTWVIFFTNGFVGFAGNGIESFVRAVRQCC